MRASSSLRGRLAGPEAGQPDLLGELREGPFEVGLQLGEGHLHIDANPRGAQLLDGALHGRAPRVDLVDGSVVLLVGVTGFEPAAFRSQSGCATKLRYTPSDHRRYYGPGTPTLNWIWLDGRRYSLLVLHSRA